jgi:hypothetical protein
VKLRINRPDDREKPAVEVDDPKEPHFFQEALPGSNVCRLCKGLRSNRIHDKVETSANWG